LTYMKVTYFHGLKSKRGGPKVEFLPPLFDDVYALLRHE